MAMPRAPIDPYCRLNGRGSRVTEKDTDADLAALAAYAKAHAVHVWRYPDGKLALTSELYARQLNRGRNAELAPLVFGNEGDSIGRTAAEAMSALREQSTYITQSARWREQMERASAEQKLDPTFPTADPLDIIEQAHEGAITQSVRTFAEDLPSLEEPAREINGGRRWFGGSALIPVENALRGLGKAGAYLADLFGRRNDLVDRIRAIAFTKLNAQLERLTPEEIATGYADYVEKGIVADEARRPVLESVYREINDIDEQFYTGLKAQGVEVAPRVGAGPLNPTGRYFPHRRDLSALGDRRLAESMIADTQARAAEYGVQLTPDQALDVIEQQGWGNINRERAIEKLIESAKRYQGPEGKGLPRDDAERLLDQMIQGSDRISGALERHRKLNTDGYIKDMRRAYTATWTRNAYRLADVATFGLHDAKVHQALGEMRYDPALGGRGADFAKKVYDLEIGRTKLDSSLLMKELYGWQAAKLSLALLANSTQSLNTVVRVGMKPFLKAAYDAARAPREFGGSVLRERSTVATVSGALPVKMYQSDTTQMIAQSMLQDTRENGMQAMLGPAERLLGEGAGRATDFFLDKLLSPFRWVENWNRSLAQRAGEYYFDQIAHQLTTRGEAGLTHRAIGKRLTELGLAPERVLDAVRSGRADALAEMRTLAGLRVSNETQFKSNYQAMPLWAHESEPGRFLMQYKNFAINQAKFAIRELDPRMAKRDPARALRAYTTVALAYPAVGIALTAARQDLFGPTIAGQQLADALEDPSFGNVLKAGFIGMSLAGGLGIVADVGMTAALGNDFAIKNFFVPPAASSVANGLGIIGSAGRGIVNADPEELLKMRSSFLREFGGLGGVVEERLRRKEGRAEEPIELGPALARVLR